MMYVNQLLELMEEDMRVVVAIMDQVFVMISTYWHALPIVSGKLAAHCITFSFVSDSSADDDSIQSTV